MKQKTEDIERRRLGLEFKASDPLSPDAILTISGYASTKEVDSYNEIVEPSAFAETMTRFMEHPILLFGHDWWSKPIGKITDWKIDETGLWVQAEIADTTEGRDVATLIKFGILKAFSIGFRRLSWSDPEDNKDPVVIEKLRLFEISVVNLPANPTTLFDEAASLDIELQALDIKHLQPHSTESPTGGGSSKKEPIMPDPIKIDDSAMETIRKCERIVKDHEDSLATVQGEVENLQNNIDDQAKLLKGIQEAQEKVRDGLMTESEFRTYTDKVGGDILELQEDIKKAKNAKKVEVERIPFNDWRQMDGAKNLTFVFDDQGRPLDEAGQKYYRMFGMPVSYEGDRGSLLKTLRDLHDTVYVTHQYMMGQKVHGYDITQLKSYGLLMELAEIVSPDFAKAMATSNTGFGAEWYPTEMSAQILELYRLEPAVENFIGTFDLPSQGYEWPIQTSMPSMYRATQRTVNNADQLTRSDVGTDKITFTTETFAVAVTCSPEMLEDAVIQMVPFLTGQMVEALRDGNESKLLNGDDTATHRDTGHSYTALNPETYEDGLRFMAVDQSKSFDTASASVGDATTAFAAKDVRYLRKLMGKMGKNSKKCVFVCNVDVFFHIINMSEFSQPGTYAAGASWATGDISLVDGCRLHVSEKMSNEENTTGVYDGSTTTKSSILCFNPDAFMIGYRRGTKVDYQYDALTQQNHFVASMRNCLRKMTPSTLYPVALGYNATTA